MDRASNDEVLFAVNNQKGIITLNRPKALNALNLNIFNAMKQQLREWHDSKAVQCVIVEGAGDKAFCAGGDIKQLVSLEKGSDQQMLLFQSEYQLDYLTSVLDVPYIALIHGITMGGGLGISIHAKYRVATEKTTIAMPETAIGLFPDVGASYFLSKLPCNLGTLMGLTGYRLKGADCQHAGLATHMCTSSSLPDLKQELIGAKNECEMGAILKKYDSEFPFKEPFSLSSKMEFINDCFSLEKMEDIAKHLEASDDAFAAETLKDLAKMCPTSLKITLRLLRRGKRMNSLKKSLELDYLLMHKVCAADNIYEGVRAALIDKDKNPRWKPALLQDVADSEIDGYFEENPSNKILNL